MASKFQCHRRLQSTLQHLDNTVSSAPTAAEAEIAEPMSAAAVAATSLISEGYVHIPGVLSKAFMAELVAEMSALETDSFQGDVETGDKKLVNNAWNRSAIFLPVIDYLPTADIADMSLSTAASIEAPGEHSHVISMAISSEGGGTKEEPLSRDYSPMEVEQELLVEGAVTIPVSTHPT